MNHKRLTREEIEEQIKDIFSKHPSPKEIKKAKRIAMSKNIKLTSYKKKFCKKCFNLYTLKNSELRIKKPLKIIKCRNCGYVSRYGLKED